MKKFNLPVVVEGDEDGYYVFCPVLQGCYSQGDTYEEALKNIQDAIKLYVSDILSEKGEIKIPKSLSLTSLEVAV